MPKKIIKTKNKSDVQILSKGVKRQITDISPLRLPVDCPDKYCKFDYCSKDYKRD